MLVLVTCPPKTVPLVIRTIQPYCCRQKIGGDLPDEFTMIYNSPMYEWLCFPLGSFGFPDEAK